MKTLADISTRELLDAQRTMRTKSWDIDDGVAGDEFVFCRLGPGGVYDNVVATGAQIYEELAKREHVNNKPHSKMIRRLCSRHGITPDEVRKQFAKKFC